MDVLSSVLAVFDAIGDWIPQAVDSIVPMFYGPVAGGEGNQLTFIGVLTVAGLAFSVIFLIIGVIQNFLRFRG